MTWVRRLAHLHMWTHRDNHRSLKRARYASWWTKEYEATSLIGMHWTSSMAVAGKELEVASAVAKSAFHPLEHRQGLAAKTITKRPWAGFIWWTGMDRCCPLFHERSHFTRLPCTQVSMWLSRDQFKDLCHQKREKGSLVFQSGCAQCTGSLGRTHLFSSTLLQCSYQNDWAWAPDKLPFRKKRSRIWWNLHPWKIHRCNG